MTDKKLTESEIIKLLECCKKSQCSNCEYSKKKCDGYTQVNYALDLINRQNAEIERLQKEVNLVSIQFQDLQERYEEAQEEIERLKNYELVVSVQDTLNTLRRLGDFINNLLKDKEEEVLNSETQSDKS